MIKKFDKKDEESGRFLRIASLNCDSIWKIGGLYDLKMEEALDANMWLELGFAYLPVKLFFVVFIFIS